MAPGNQEVFDYYLLPRIETQSNDLRLREENGLHWDAYRFNSLDRK